MKAGHAIAGLLLGDSLVLPVDAAAARHVLLAKSGFGKTNASAVITEEVARAGVHVIVADPLGKRTSFESSGGTFAKYLSQLRGLELVHVDSTGVRASDALFPTGPMR